SLLVFRLRPGATDIAAGRARHGTLLDRDRPESDSSRPRDRGARRGPRIELARETGRLEEKKGISSPESDGFGLGFGFGFGFGRAHGMHRRRSATLVPVGPQTSAVPRRAKKVCASLFAS